MDRDQAFLLPPSMTDWLPDTHLVWFVIEAVKRLDSGAFHRRAKLGGVGRQGYDPDMLLTLFVYAMAHGLRSSRKIERQCETDLAFKIICAGDVPDHTVLARFRQRHQTALEDVLTEVLVLCAELGMVRLGTVAFDGTKIAANASMSTTYTEEHLRKLAREHLSQTAANDEAEDRLFGDDDRGDELPDKVKDRTHRGARISQALANIDKAKAEAAEAAQADRQAAEAYVRKAGNPGRAQPGGVPKGVDPVEVAQARLDRERSRAQRRREDYAAKAAAAAAKDHKLPGTPPAPVDEQRLVKKAQDQLGHARASSCTASNASGASSADDATAETLTANLTDPDSRLLPTRHGWLQGYNCQTAVSDDGFIVTARATQDANDTAQFVPTVAAVTDIAVALAERTGRDDLDVGTLIGDAGYDTDNNLDADGPDRLIANSTRRNLTRRAAENPATGDPPDNTTAREKMDHRLRTPGGQDLYKRRAPLAETPNAWLKDGRGLRDRFSRRGRPAANSELSFAAAVTNLIHLRNQGITAAQLANP